MGSIISSYVFPHPPLIVPEVGRGDESGAESTVNAAKKAAENIRDDRPTTIIVTSPHGPYFRDLVYVSDDEKLVGDLGRFRAPNVKMSYDNNIGLVEKIVEYASERGITCGGLEDELAQRLGVSKKLDHGTTVPLYYINREYSDFKLVHIGMAALPLIDLYKFGMCIAKAVEQSDERVVFVASGDLSHKLKDEGPYGFDKRGPEFDELIVDIMKSADVKRIIDIDEDFCESAGECGLRSFVMMFGALDGLELKPELYSYEGPFGVGYAVARFEIGARNPEREFLKEI